MKLKKIEKIKYITIHCIICSLYLKEEYKHVYKK